MEKRVLGRTGLSVSAIGLGTGQFGQFGLTTERDCVRIAHCAFDGGVTLIDTADFYSLGEAETIVGQAIADRRDKVILSTKCGMSMSADPNERGGSRHWILTACERSLRRLKTDYIDIYHLHVPDPYTDLGETLEALNTLLRAGKVRYLATSNFPSELIVESQFRAQLANLVAPHAEQSSYSIFRRSPEIGVLPVCDRFGVGFFAYSPLDGGWLSGKYGKGKVPEASPRQRLQPGRFDMAADYNRRKLVALDGLCEIAADAGVELSHLSLAFVLAHKAVTSALIGGGKVSYIEKHLAGNAVRLTDDILDRIDAVVPPGETLNIDDNALSAPLLKDKTKRRRASTVTESSSRGFDFIREVTARENER